MAGASEGAVTTNATLKSWIPAESDVATLVALDNDAKVNGHVRVAYQVPEQEGGPVGRSFEDAFILANAQVLAAKLDDLATQKAFIADTDDPTFRPQLPHRSQAVKGTRHGIAPRPR